MKKIIFKNIRFLVISSFIAVLFVFFITDYISFKSYNIKNKSYFNEYYKYKKKTQQEIAKKYIFDTSSSTNFRDIENKNSNLESIILFGTNEVYGLNLNPDETISHNLSKLTSRPIYNRVKSESSLNHMYYQLSNEDFYKIIKKPKYIFYFYTPKQLILTNNKYDFGIHDIYYKLKNGKIEKYKKIPLNKRLFLIGKINKTLYKNNFLYYFYKKDSAIFKTLLSESKNEAQKHWGKDVNFVIIICNKNNSPFEDEIFKDLKNKGFIIFELNNCLNSKKQKNDISKPDFWIESAKILTKEFKLNE